MFLIFLVSKQVEWSGGPETMEEILSRIQQREEAATKRERAMAYAFSHQACRLVTKLKFCFLQTQWVREPTY